MTAITTTTTTTNGEQISAEVGESVAAGSRARTFHSASTRCTDNTTTTNPNNTVDGDGDVESNDNTEDHEQELGRTRTSDDNNNSSDNSRDDDDDDGPTEPLIRHWSFLSADDTVGTFPGTLLSRREMFVASVRAGTVRYAATAITAVCLF